VAAVEEELVRVVRELALPVVLVVLVVLVV
jgi:hypothetical protein